MSSISSITFTDGVIIKMVSSDQVIVFQEAKWPKYAFLIKKNDIWDVKNFFMGITFLLVYLKRNHQRSAMKVWGVTHARGTHQHLWKVSWAIVWANLKAFRSRGLKLLAAASTDHRVRVSMSRGGRSMMQLRQLCKITGESQAITEIIWLSWRFREKILLVTDVALAPVLKSMEAPITRL